METKLGQKKLIQKSRNSGKAGGEALNVKVATEAIVIIIVYFLQNQHILVFSCSIITTSNKFWPPRIYGFASFQSQPDFYNKNCKVFHQQQLTRSIMMTVITRGTGGRECQGRLQGLEAGGASSCSSAMPAWQQSTSLFRHMLLQQVPPWRSH